jgi:hypothetical protein
MNKAGRFGLPKVKKFGFYGMIFESIGCLGVNLAGQD